jgi:hypothetical protein
LKSRKAKDKNSELTLLRVKMKQNNGFKKVRKLLPKAKKLFKEKGIHYVVRAGIKIIVTPLINSFRYYYYKISK